MIGVGTYANNKTCAISCTGHGEIFIKAVAAYDVSSLMEYKNFPLQQACEEVVLKKLVAMHGDGGLIGVDAKGNIAMVFNSAGMYRGSRNSDGENIIAIYGS
jgi:beta-aspartyl-peptidase (threonine type)